eukprot:CAMPEP_0180211090 /NCGR_PEP_ID=MMETSP0987-20121128/12587_1 /TAXON_ID=697907 /ORGANISM="non described non described, Strain CCMP2293" /LENGTH=150 /DNA_ID=CAMNT_0022168279 /DNA_START=105 /DNA_END=558 /DNA_ORIENTATION=+
MNPSNYTLDPDYIPPNTFGGKPVKRNKFPVCQTVFDKYYQCTLVDEAKFGKFIGRCNDLKDELDRCNIAQQVIVRKENLVKARERNRLIAERMAANDKHLAEAREKAAKSEAGGTPEQGKGGGSASAAPSGYPLSGQTVKFEGQEVLGRS